ncbi:conserved hypothetical protein [Frankia sp. AiPs1]|uniref:hypothetical protein n=1 Tax=Frankia sp. AiPa1 TaxID=573492 RepID=UPI00202AE6B1|nr:hypothetical protein [Frankia sp. AiPa1]MCL9761130.1 hypothetical protein [Frankia sp. AiPa1]
MRPRPAAAAELAVTGDAPLGVPVRGGAGPAPVGTPRTTTGGVELADGPGRPATVAEAEAITAALLDSPLLPSGELRVTGIRTSTGAPDWAFAVLRVPGGPDPSIAVLRWETCSGWVLDQIGSARLSLGMGAGSAARRPELTITSSAVHSPAAARPHRDAAGRARRTARRG